MCVVDLMLTCPDRTELADGRLRRGISEGAGGCTFAMLTVSSKSRNETSVVRVCSMRGTSDEAVCRMNRTITLRMYFTHKSSSGGGSCHDGAVECTDDAPCGSLLLGTGESGADNGCSSPLEFCVHRDAMVMFSTFKMKSWDWRTSIVKCPVCISICFLKKKKNHVSFRIIDSEEASVSGLGAHLG